MNFPFISPVYAADSTWTGDCVKDGVATIRGIECVVKNILSPAPALIALCAVGMIIIAGFRITTSSSDPKALAAAWQTFTWAIIGLILLSASWLALVLIEKFTGAQVTDFGIPGF